GLLDGLDLHRGGLTRLLADLVLEALAGLVHGQTGDLLELGLGPVLGGLGLAGHGLGSLLPALDGALALLELALTALGVLLLAAELPLARDQGFFLLGHLGPALADFLLDVGLQLEGELLALDLGGFLDL